jgi:hypothetical protein
MTTAERKALEEIASASPTIHSKINGDQHRCTMCRVMIDTARAALGYQEWPAQPKTPKETNGIH